MENFYLIPINDNNIFINGARLSGYLNQNYKTIYQLYEVKSDLIRSVNNKNEVLENLRRQHIKTNNEEIEMLSEHLQVPLYLIAYGNDSIAREIFTDTLIEASHNALAIRKIDDSKVSEYLGLDYSDRVRNFLNYLPKKIIKRDDKSSLFLFKSKLISTINYLYKKHNINADVDNDQRLDFVIMFLLKHDLNFVDFAILSDMYLNSNKKNEYEKSELVKDLKEILIMYGFADNKIKKLEK